MLHAHIFLVAASQLNLSWKYKASILPSQVLIDVVAMPTVSCYSSYNPKTDSTPRGLGGQIGPLTP